MHVFPAMLIGLAVWIAVIVFASVKLYALGAGPFIVSGIALVLAILPCIEERKNHGAVVAYTLTGSLVIVVGSLLLI